MADIAYLDPNFADRSVDEKGMVYLNCLEEPFRVYGLLPPNEAYPYFRRMPQDVADSVSPRVGELAKNAAGGRLRFRTDSSRISLRVTLASVYRAAHFTLLGSAGFDIYDGTRFVTEMRPPYQVQDSYCCEGAFGIKELRDVTINFPLYSTVANLEIGLEAGSQILAPKDYQVTVPVVYYGSSITQGGCASRPGCSYESIISRRLDCDYINLGFSGNGKAELEIANYIADLSMSAFVYDYDHNAPDVAYLQATHERMFRIVREKNPELPILMLSRPRYQLNETTRQRRDVIMQTYLNARAAGDKNVYFLDGSKMLHIFGGDCGTVDGVHPNDLGFACMAQAIGDVLAEIL